LEETATIAKTNRFSKPIRGTTTFFSVSAEKKWKKISQGDGGRRGSRTAESVTGIDERISLINQPVFIQDLSKICVSIDQKY
jgi:hypothetical protein